METLTREITVMGQGEDHARSLLNGKYDVDKGPDAWQVGYALSYLHPDEDPSALDSLPSAELAGACPCAVTV